MKHQTRPERTRNDDNTAMFPFDSASSNDSDAVKESHRLQEFSAEDLNSGPEVGEVYAKRRKSAKRTRNDEDTGSVRETTKSDGVYAKRRNESKRTRNDESRSIADTRLKPDTARSALLPERYPNEDMFICDVLDAIPKDDMASMEHPMFTLATRPDMRTIHYEHNENRIAIIPSSTGLATIHDKDILIYCVSQLIAKMNRGEPVSRTVYLKAYDLLVWSNRQISGDGYSRLIAALDRLSGTRIKTNIKAGDEEIIEGFGLISEYRVVRQKETGVMSEIKIQLSEWLFRMVQGKTVLTLHRDYFRLRKPLERRIYEIARKHCGAQPRWKISTELLFKKSGSAGNIRQFRGVLRELEASNHLPDYVLEMVDDGVVFTNRDHMGKLGASGPRIPYVDPEGMHDAKLVAPGYDVHALYAEWGQWWIDSGSPELGNVNAAFVGFCRARHQRNPLR